MSTHFSRWGKAPLHPLVTSLGISPPNPHGNRTGYQQTSISKAVLPNHAMWDIGLFECLAVITTSYV